MLDFNPGEHICVVGDARPEKTNPIYLAHEKVILILVVERATGLIVDAYFSGTKIKWILDHVEGAREQALPPLRLCGAQPGGRLGGDPEQPFGQLSGGLQAGAVRRRPVRPDEVPGQHQSGA